MLINSFFTCHFASHWILFLHQDKRTWASLSPEAKCSVSIKMLWVWVPSYVRDCGFKSQLKYGWVWVPSEECNFTLNPATWTFGHLPSSGWALYPRGSLLLIAACHFILFFFFHFTLSSLPVSHQKPVALVITLTSKTASSWLAHCLMIKAKWKQRW